MLTTNTPLVALELVAASIWVGSLVCLAVVTAAARRVLDTPSQATLFRAVGRRYGPVGPTALLVAIGAGLALSWPPSAWSSITDSAVALAGLLVIASAADIAQARAMTRRRRQVASRPRGPRPRGERTSRTARGEHPARPDGGGDPGHRGVGCANHLALTAWPAVPEVVGPGPDVSTPSVLAVVDGSFVRQLHLGRQPELLSAACQPLQVGEYL